MWPCSGISGFGRPAILIVMIELCVFTALFGLAAHALNGLQVVNGDVNAPGAQGVRDYLLRYMGRIFVGGAINPAVGHLFGVVVSIVFTLLLLSASNTPGRSQEAEESALPQALG